MFPALALASMAVFAGALLAYAKRGETAMTDKATVTPDEVKDFFVNAGERWGVDPDLLRSIAFAESSSRADAVRWNPPNDVSVGMMQILCTPPLSVKRGEDYTCTNRFNLEGWPATYASLKDAETNINLGAQLLAWNLREYGFPRGVAVYNSFAARWANEQGPFPNDSYVNRVLSHFNQLKGKQV